MEPNASTTSGMRGNGLLRAHSTDNAEYLPPSTGEAPLALSPADLRVLAGFALCFLVELAMLSQALPSSPSIFSAALFHCGVVIAYLANRADPERQAKSAKSRRLAAIAILTALAAGGGIAKIAVGGAGDAPSSAASALQSLCLGWSNAELFFFWLTASRSYSASLSAFRLPSALLIGSLLLGGASYLASEARDMLMIVLPLANLALAFIPLHGSSAPAKGAGEERATVPRLRLSRSVSLVLCGIDCLLGFVACVSVHQAVSMQAMPPFGAATGLLAALLAGFLLTARGRSLSFGSLYTLVAPCLACMVVLLAANVPALAAVCGVAALSALMLVCCTNVNWLDGIALKYGFPIRAYVVQGRTAANIGRLVGIVLGIGFVRVAASASSTVLIVFVAGILLAFMLISSRLPYFSGTPIDKGYVDDELRTVGDKASWSLNESFNARCNAVALEKKLTARESELLKLLARGYNNETISQILFLAPSTVKTHTYHIYKKLGVHTQQELIRQITPVGEPDGS